MLKQPICIYHLLIHKYSVIGITVLYSMISEIRIILVIKKGIMIPGNYRWLEWDHSKQSKFCKITLLFSNFWLSKVELCILEFWILYSNYFYQISHCRITYFCTVLVVKRRFKKHRPLIIHFFIRRLNFVNTECKKQLI